MKILLIRFSSIGDIVLTTPVIRAVHKAYPDAKIHFATKAAFRTVLQHHPLIHQLHLLDDSLEKLIQSLQRAKFDCVLDLHHNQRTFYIKARLGVPAYSFQKLNWQKWLLVNFKINRLPDKHIVQRYLETGKELGLSDDGEGLDYYLADSDYIPLSHFPMDFSKGYIGWVIGAKQGTKQFPKEKIARALKEIQYPVLLLGGKDDQRKAEEILHLLQNPAHVASACGKYSLNQSASLVKQASMIITNDTGLMHIAAAFQKRIITLWGNTVPAFGMYPYYGNQKVPYTGFEAENVSCRPCSKLGYSTCPKGHFRCMNDINEMVVAALANQWMGEML